MFIIDKKIVSAELFKKKFVCDLSKCKGSCCWEGDFGAPVADHEVEEMRAVLPKIKSLLSSESISIIEEEGVAPHDKKYNRRVTPLHPNGACVYLYKDGDGIAKCSFEKLFSEGQTTFKKPLSCHLYPIRITYNEKTKFEALNYDEWDICSAACKLGEDLKMPVFRFLKEAIIRKYGEEFYTQMEDIYNSYFG